MDSTRYDDDLEASKAQVKRLTTVAAVLAVGLLLSLVLMLNLLGRDRTIVTPPVIDKSFWVTADNVSDAYIQQMSLWLSTLILDVTPDDIAYKSRLLLQYAHPELHGKLKERQDLEAQRIKRDNIATYFVLQTIRTSPERLTAVITGRLHTLINGSRVADQERNFLIKWRMEGGRAQLIEFVEASHADVNKLLNPNAAQ